MANTALLTILRFLILLTYLVVNTFEYPTNGEHVYRGSNPINEDNAYGGLPKRNNTRKFKTPSMSRHISLLATRDGKPKRDIETVCS